MNVALQGMLDRYQPHTLADHENALKEIVQELALLGLWRARFFEHAAFLRGHGAAHLSSISLCGGRTATSISRPTSKQCVRSWRRSVSTSALSAGASG